MWDRTDVGISLDPTHVARVTRSDCGEHSGTTGTYMSWIPRIGAEFAGYRLDALLGHGGMSIVYRAQHIVLERNVALKLLSPQLSEDESFRERFMRESRLAARLDHPNIIPIYEASESDDVFFIAMRYVEGADLRKLLKDGPVDPKRLTAIIDQTANALTVAHAGGLVHRDVKPANILIDPGSGRDGSDHVYLSDFGVAKQTAAPGITTSGTFVGTVDYASPEQIEGKPLDGRADVYSLGCVIYECLTGSSAFDKDSEVAVMYAHLLEPPPAVTVKRPDLPAEIDDVIATAMAKSKDERYETPKQLAAALSRVLGPVAAGAGGWMRRRQCSRRHSLIRRPASTRPPRTPSRPRLGPRMHRRPRLSRVLTPFPRPRAALLDPDGRWF